jgi:hypothetical protein
LRIRPSMGALRSRTSSPNIGRSRKTAPFIPGPEGCDDQRQTCINCSVWFNNSQECFAGGMAISGNVVQGMRYVGISCWSKTYGMFIFMIGSAELKYFPSSNNGKE